MRAPEQCFFVLAMPRSGSTWVQQTLDAHPQLSCLNEPSNISHNPALRWLMAPLEAAAMLARHDGGLGPENIKARLLSRLSLRYSYDLEKLDKDLGKTGKAHSGAKLVFPNLIKDLDFVHFFMRYSQARFILLDRDCAVDALCSLIIARRTRLWHSSASPERSIKPFSVNAERAEHYLASHFTYRRLVETLLETYGIAHMQASYEALMASPEEGLAAMTAFLGVGECVRTSSLQKLSPRPYRDIVTNYDELAALEQSLKQRLGGAPALALVRTGT